MQAQKRMTNLDKHRIRWILEHLDEGRDHFVMDLVGLLEAALDSGDTSPIEECLDEWEAVAELDSMPGFKAKIWEGFNKLKERGIVQ